MAILVVLDSSKYRSEGQRAESKKQEESLVHERNGSKYKPEINCQSAGRELYRFSTQLPQQKKE